MKAKADEIGESRKSERNREMGRRLSTMAYFISFNDLPFTVLSALVYFKPYRYG